MKRTVIAALIVFLFLACLLPASMTSANPGWDYYRVITITNGGSAQTNYQVRVHIEDTSNMQSNGADLRFTNDANTVKYPYWVESWATNDAYVWVKVSSIPAGKSYMRMWYGNADTSSESDGDATFEFFDDFEDTDFSEWTTLDAEITRDNIKARTGSYVAKISGTGDSGAYQSLTVSSRVATVWFYDDESASIEGIGAGTRSMSSSSNWMGVRTRDASYYQWYFESWTDTSVLRSTDWHRLEWANDGTNIKGYVDGTLAHTWSVVEEDNKIYLNGWFGTGGGHGFFDTVYICKYADPEPTITSIGGQNDATPGWEYYRMIEIYNGGSALTDYQIRVHITDTNNMQADGADLRFTSFDEHCEN